MIILCMRKKKWEVKGTQPLYMFFNHLQIVLIPPKNQKDDSLFPPPNKMEKCGRGGRGSKGDIKKDP